MGIQYELSVVDDRIQADCKGFFDLNESAAIFREAFAMADRMELSKVLVHFVEVLGVPTTTQRFELATKIAKAYSNRKPARFLLVAMLLRPEALDPKRFGETVARNRGMAARVTDDEAEALAWLNSESH